MAAENLIKKVPTVNYFKASGSNEQLEKCNTLEKLKRFYDSIDLVVSTCYSFKNPIFKEIVFDYCIIDEGSQINLLLALIPISRSKKFVVVGDHLQISPINNSSQSIFERCLHLDKTYCVLTTQYRMGSNIMKLSNSLFYNNKMTLGVQREGEVNIIDSSKIEMETFIKSLRECTVLCYFNSQVKLLSQYNEEIVITTIDKFQGSEDDRVILIFDPILNNKCQACPKRLNVGLTRSRKSLTLVGNLVEMKKVPLFNLMLNTLNK